MSNQVKIFENKDFDNVADNIKKVADMAKLAASNLRDAYIFESENDKVKALRTEVFNSAHVYNDKILPFTEASIVSIKDLCKTIRDYDYDVFKENLDYIVEKAEKEENFCEFTKIFHLTILTEFKIIKNKVERDEQMSSLTHGNTNENEKALHIPERVMKPLKNSIDKYIDYLRETSGLFYSLLSDLRTLNDRFEEITSENMESRVSFHYRLICKNTESIVNSCEYLIKLKPDNVSDLGSIDEEPDKNCVNGWIPKVVKENYMEDNLAKLIKYNRRLKKICG